MSTTVLNDEMAARLLAAVGGMPGVKGLLDGSLIVVPRPKAWLIVDEPKKPVQPLQHTLTITIGRYATGDEYCDALKTAQVRCDDDVLQILQSAKGYCQKPTLMTIVERCAKDLEVIVNTIGGVYQGAKKNGLQLCPLDVVPTLCLEGYRPPGYPMRVAMDALGDVGISIETSGTDIVLCARDNRPDNVIDPRKPFLFCKPA